MRLRFQKTGTDFMAEIRKIRDFKQLESILQAVETVANPEELRKLFVEVPESEMD